MDVDVSGLIEDTETTDVAGEWIHRRIMDVASGDRVTAEIAGYDEAGTNCAIYVSGPTI